jgi:hypothetical protein
MATAALHSNYSTVYGTASPFPHILIDDFVETRRLRSVAVEVAGLKTPPDGPVYGQHKKRATSDRALLGAATLGLIDELNAPAFLRWLERLTGIAGLAADPSLFGGGVHQIEPGGFLKIHTDFNWHADLRLYRRLNLLLYLNDGWRNQWAGHLELWHPDMSACGARIAPLFNRMVIFSTTDESYHGHPEPLACPDGVTRNSIALYYYAAEPAPSRFGKSELTNYRERPGERFGSLKHKVHQARIRLGPILRP